MWILKTGAQWHMMPQCHPNYKTVHRRFQKWCRTGVLDRALRDLAGELRDSGRIDGSEAFIDASFARAKGGGPGVGLTKVGKGMKIMAIADRSGLPLSVSVHAANHHETKLAQLSLDLCLCGEPANLIGDKAYDSDPLDAELRERGGDDRAAPAQPDAAQDAGRAPAAAVQAPLDRGTVLRVASVEPPGPGPLGISYGELSRLRPDRSFMYVAKTFLR